MLKDSGRYTNTELRTALKGFPKGMRLRLSWCLKDFPMQVHVFYKVCPIVNPLLVYGSVGKLTEEQLLKRTINALYRHVDRSISVMHDLADAMYWDSRAKVGLSADREESELLARIYLENFKIWYKDWVKHGRKVNLHT